MKQWSVDHPDLDAVWFERSNYLGILAVKNEEGLLKLIDKASSRGLRFSIFFEPDLNYEITAIALEPSKESKRLCGQLPLALKNI